MSWCSGRDTRLLPFRIAIGVDHVAMKIGRYRGRRLSAMPSYRSVNIPVGIRQACVHFHFNISRNIVRHEACPNAGCPSTIGPDRLDATVDRRSCRITFDECQADSTEARQGARIRHHFRGGSLDGRSHVAILVSHLAHQCATQCRNGGDAVLSLDLRGLRNSMPCAPHIASTPKITFRFLFMRSKRRAAWAAMLT